MPEATELLGSNNMNYVLYHANCPDGFWAAYAAWRALGENAQYIPVSYGQPFPKIEKGGFLYLVDFSYDRATLLDLMNDYNVTVLDHHKTAQKELDGLSKCYFNLEKSGAVMTWEYFHNTPVPELIKYVQDRDLWQWKLPNSREVNAALTLQPKDFENNTRLLNYPIDFYVNTGKIVLSTHRLMIEKLVEQAFTYQIGNYTIPVVNSTVLQSELGEALLAKYPEAPFVGIFNHPKNLTERNWSLRSRQDFDCGVFAKQYGGGGHPGAAGFIEKLT